MNRPALSLSLLLATAPAALAEGHRSLGVTVVPVGGYLLSDVREGVVAGYTAGVGWDYGQQGAIVSLTGHVASSLRLTQATPLALRIGASPGRRKVRPFAGVGVALLLEHPPAGRAGSPLKVGPEVGAGVEVGVGDRLFATAEARYQAFADADARPGWARTDLASVLVGLGFFL